MAEAPTIAADSLTRIFAGNLQPGAPLTPQQVTNLPIGPMKPLEAQLMPEPAPPVGFPCLGHPGIPLYIYGYHIWIPFVKGLE